MLQLRLYAHLPPFNRTETYVWYGFCGNGGSVKCRRSQPAGLEECTKPLNSLSNVRTRGEGFLNAPCPTMWAASAQLPCSIFSTFPIPPETPGVSLRQCELWAGSD